MSYRADSGRTSDSVGMCEREGYGVKGPECGHGHEFSRGTVRPKERKKEVSVKGVIERVFRLVQNPR